jgi:hypothetical protein
MTSSFTREGGEAYLQDLPHAEMHWLDSGHFGVEDCLAEISSNMHKFYREKVAVQGKGSFARRGIDYSESAVGNFTSSAGL